MTRYYNNTTPAGPNTTPWDGNPWPGDKDITRLSSAEVANDLMKLNVPGVNHNNGRAQNLELWHNHLQAIRDQAGKQAVAKYLASEKVG